MNSRITIQGGLLYRGRVTEAENAIESPDIENGEYIRAFDENGAVFTIETLGTKRLDSGIIPMPGVLKPTNTDASAELHDLLWLRLPEETPKQSTPLKVLVNRALELSKINRSRYLPLPRVK